MAQTWLNWRDWISTHTPHARRDGTGCRNFETYSSISTHTPHARRD